MNFPTKHINMLLTLFLICPLFLPVNVIAQEKEQPSPGESPGFYGFPLKYVRTMNYQQSYPELPAFYVYRVQEESRARKAGLEAGTIISEIDGQPVKTEKDVRQALSNRASDTVGLTILELSPRIQQKMREDPFYQPTGNENYRTSEMVVDYSPKKPRDIPSLEGRDQRLYHRHGLSHSPDPDRARSFSNPNEAEQAGLEPCPICFPEREQSTFQLLVRDQLGETSELVTKLKREHETIKDVSGHIRSIGVRLFRQRLRQDINPNMLVLDTERFHGFGVPNGTIILSSGLNFLMESDEEIAAQLAHQMAHMDLRHDHSPVQKKRFQDLLEEAVKRTTGVSFSFSDLKDISPSLPGFGIYREILEQGYGKQQERETIFLAMVYLYRSGLSMDGAEAILKKREDMQNDVHPRWLEYLLKHPIPSSFRRDIREWKERIPKSFDRNLAP